VPRKAVVLEMLLVSQILNEFPVFYGIQSSVQNFHKNPPMNPNLRQINLFQILSHCVPVISILIHLSSTTRSPTCYMPSQYYYPSDVIRPPHHLGWKQMSGNSSLGNFLHSSAIFCPLSKYSSQNFSHFEHPQ